jgi:predicted ArsR family transcriptional regulator
MSMPRIAQPKMEPEVREAFEVLRNPVNFAILSTLMVDGVQTRGQIAERLDLGVKAIQLHLSELRAMGLIESSPLPEPDGSRHRTEYRVVSGELEQRYLRLGQALGLNNLFRSGGSSAG